jgi:transcriptional regulator with XRE-family HTH domain
MDFSMIGRSGLTQREFGELCGVSRVTVNLWIAGKMGPHRYIKDTVEHALDTVSAALDTGKLPFSNTATKEERQAAVTHMALEVRDMQTT